MNWQGLENKGIYWHDNLVGIFNKDCRNMSELPDESVQCVVTSPPYFGLRKYAGDQELIWGGQPECEHQWTRKIPSAGYRSSDSNPGKLQSLATCQRTEMMSQICSLCGAWRGALGNEPTPELYITHLVDLMREVKRVLRKDGTMWLNIGDSMWGGKGQSGQGSPEYQANRQTESLNKPHHQMGGYGRVRALDGQHNVIKPLDRCGIPERLILALQEDGWYWRSTVVWAKPNCIPESIKGWRWEHHRVKVGNRGRGKEKFSAEVGGQDHDGKCNFQSDAIWADCSGCSKCSPNDGYILRKGAWRPTDAHEYIFQLTKTDKYYSDGEAVCKPYSPATFPRMLRGVGDHKYALHPEMAGGGTGRAEFEEWQYSGQATKDYDEAGVQNPSDTKRRIIEAIKKNETGANLRSVWSFPTEAAYDTKICAKCLRQYGKDGFTKLRQVKVAKEGIEVMRVACVCGEMDKWIEHFAAFPETLVDICVKASTPEAGCCAKCGTPWARIVDHKPMVTKPSPKHDGCSLHGTTNICATLVSAPETQTLGWKPTCTCNTIKPPVSSLVLDPFMGSGTTLWVAKRLGRRAVGYEVSEEYCKLAMERNRQGALELR